MAGYMTCRKCGVTVEPELLDLLLTDVNDKVTVFIGPRLFSMTCPRDGGVHDFKPAKTVE